MKPITHGGYSLECKPNMKISVILAHPDKNSFNHAIAMTAVDALKRGGHTLCFHDLYEEQFDPIMPLPEIPKASPLSREIEKHCREIAAAEGIVVVHPNWWGQPPAILKGWVDRILRSGVAYEFLENDRGEGVPRGLLRAKTAIVFNTSNTDTEREKCAFGDPLELIWKNCIFDLCGVPNFYRRIFTIVVVSSEKQRTAWLQEVRQTVEQYFPGNNGR